MKKAAIKVLKCVSVNRKTVLLLITFFILQQFSFGQNLSPGLSPEFVSVVGRSNFIFTGTITHQDSSNITVHTNKRKAIVKVNELLDVPAIYHNVKGKEITVFFATNTIDGYTGGSKVYYTSAWYFGKTIGVKEIKNSLNKVLEPNLQNKIAQARIKIADDSLHAELKRAELVIVGTVLNAGMDSSKLHAVRSEHNPELMGARIKIKKILKGNINKKWVIGFYAASNDILWEKSPKLSNSQVSIFLLHTWQAAGPIHLQGYTLLDPRDVQPANSFNKIKKLLIK
jgi:hypothetical protein